ncbi:2OG-Fe(II) oxygenase [Yoonia sp. BS5-3]|uniref:2OG-Fe(II) oxygenase n=1 Tax=Yoonia phaeophyticola TaxID=3137369 RepID=A0ABZ2V0A8_9RHOB
MMAVHSVPNAFTTGECDHIVAAISNIPTYDALLAGRNRDHNLRHAELVWMDDVGDLSWVMTRLIELVSHSNKHQFDFDVREFAESPQVAKYDAAKGGHFAWHSDIGHGLAASKRKLTLVLQLSNPDTYDGGDLEIRPSAQIQMANRMQGSVSVFPSFALHQVTPIKRGIRRSLTVWAHGPPFR